MNSSADDYSVHNTGTSKESRSATDSGEAVTFKCLNEISSLLIFVLICDTLRARSIALPSAASNRLGTNLAKSSYYTTGKRIVLKFN